MLYNLQSGLKVRGLRGWVFVRSEMKDQIAMAPNGNLWVAIPLYRMHKEQEIASGFTVTLSTYAEQPLAYVLDCGKFAQVVNVATAEEHLIFLGDL